MRIRMLIVISAILIAGCGGTKPLDYEVLTPDRLPPELAEWKTLPANQVDVRDRVIGNDVFFRIEVGPCSSSKLKVKRIEAGGSRGLYVVGTLQSPSQEESYPAVYVKTRWKTRTQASPGFLTLDIDGRLHHFDGGGLTPTTDAEATKFRESVIYRLSGQFQCQKQP